MEQPADTHLTNISTQQTSRNHSTSESSSEGYCSHSSNEGSKHESEFGKSLGVQEKLVIAHFNGNGKNLIEIKKFLELCVFADIIFLSDLKGKSSEKSVSEWEETPVKAKQIQIDSSVYGRRTKNLLSEISLEVSDMSQLREPYARIQNSFGLKMDEAGNISNDASIDDNIEVLEFGCNSFPDRLIGKMLKAWTLNPTTLEQIEVSWRNTLIDRRKSVIKMNVEFLAGRMEHIWRRSQHQSSPFAKAKIESYDEKLETMESESKDLVDMYVLFSDDDEHMAVLSISDVALKVHCGFKHGKGVLPVLKQAFAHVTDIDNDYYEIVEDNIPKTNRKIH